MIDVGFHIGVTDLEGGGGARGRSRSCPTRAITSYKLFMAYKGAVMVDDETLFKTMQVANETGGARDGARRERRRDRRDRQGGRRRGEDATRSGTRARGRWRPRRRRRTARSSSRGSPAPPLYVVHVSCQPAVEPIALARDKGWDVWGETCTQYLFVDETALEKPNWEGAKYIYTPPPRPKEQQEHLWKALQTDVLSVVSTDHCPFNWPEQKGINGRDFQVVPNGGPGIENRLHMLHEFGVRTGRITIEPLRRADLHERRQALRALPAQGHDRASAATPTSSSGIRRRS